MTQPTNGGPASDDHADQHLFLQTMTEELLGWANPKVRLRDAIEQDHFLLLGQKIEPHSSMALTPCVEVLLRLQEEEDNLLPPGGFIPVAESCGMMQEIDRWVVRRTLQLAAAHEAADPTRALRYCINLSSAALDDAGFPAFVHRALEQAALNVNSVCFEIHELDTVQRHGRVQRFMQTVKPVGASFTIDAFGSSKVSFSHLKGLYINQVKIDGTIIHAIERDPAVYVKVKAIHSVCHKIGVRTIAEFVETQSLLERLRDIGVDYVQGFGIARPVRLEALTT